MPSAIKKTSYKLALLGLLLVAATHARAAETSSGCALVDPDTGDCISATPDNVPAPPVKDGFETFETKDWVEDFGNAVNDAWDAGTQMVGDAWNAAGQAANDLVNYGDNVAEGAARDATNLANAAANDLDRTISYYTNSGKRSGVGASVLVAISMAVVLMVF